ncbi:MAG: CRTAC1 family protein [Verrucomicrobia bacterium]|nr:CRTAC1 family protein [Verrucomicrobiota bacterium]
MVVVQRCGTGCPIQLRDVTRETGITFRHTDGSSGRRYIVETVSCGLATFDYDGDGDVDIYFVNGAPLPGASTQGPPPRNALYRNEGGWKFTDVTAAAGVGDTGYGLGVCTGDYDNDGDLDLYVNNFGPNVLYRNNGDGTFTDVSRASGIAAHAGTGMGMICADFDDDGDTDIVVGNDAMANFVWQNDGRGHFEEVGLLTGLAYDAHGVGQGTMGVECGDYDNDGRLDFYMTSYQKQWAILYRNLGRGLFADVNHATGAGAGTYNQVTWGIGFVDFNRDGHRDLFIACGHLQDTVDLWDDTTSYHARNLLLANTGRGKFVDVSARAGDGLAVKLSSRGAAFDDLDNDGDLDVVILNSRREPTLLRNDSPNTNHWIQVRLRGTRTNRDGIGARIKVVAGDLTLTDEVHSGRGYQSHYGSCPFFGLGHRTRIDRIEVRWIGGASDILEGVEVDRLLQITEGRSSAQ